MENWGSDATDVCLGAKVQVWPPAVLSPLLWWTLRDQAPRACQGLCPGLRALMGPPSWGLPAARTTPRASCPCPISHFHPGLWAGNVAGDWEANRAAVGGTWGLQSGTQDAAVKGRQEALDIQHPGKAERHPWGLQARSRGSSAHVGKSVPASAQNVSQGRGNQKQEPRECWAYFFPTSIFHQTGAAEPASDSSTENLTIHQAQTESGLLPQHPQPSPKALSLKTQRWSRLTSGLPGQWVSTGTPPIARRLGPATPRKAYIPSTQMGKPRL